MSSINPFLQQSIVTIAASITSTGVALPPGETIVVTNPTAALAWIAIGSGLTPPTAVAGGCIPVLPASSRVLASSPLITQIAVVLSTGAGSVYCASGTGSSIQ